MNLRNLILICEIIEDDIEFTDPKHRDYSLLDMSDITTKEMIGIGLALLIVVICFVIPWFYGAIQILKKLFM